MDLVDIRKLIVIAVASDDMLMERLVLKGGNALELIYRIGSRASLDLDFSIEDDFDDQDQIRDRLFAALKDRFDAAGFVVFDEKFGPRPSSRAPGRAVTWGGYAAEFKLISRDRFKELGGNIEALRREAQIVGPNQHRTFTIEISKFEYCGGKVVAELDDYTFYVYTPGMIAVEKLRAICQQLPAYELRRNPTPRSRDFYDIHSILLATDFKIGDASSIELLREMFQAKQVPLELLREIHTSRDFHRQDWPQVQNSVTGSLQDFDFYFDFVIKQTDDIIALLGSTASTRGRIED